MRSVENAERGKCGVWKVRSVENEECGKCGVWKMRSVEKMSYFQFFMLISHSPLLIPHSHFSNFHAGCGRRGVCNMEINKTSLMPLYSH